MRQKLANSLLLKYLLIYILVFVFFVCVLVSIYQDVYQTTKTNTISEVQSWLDRGLIDLDALTSKCREAAGYTAADSNYRSVAYANDNSMPQLTPHLLYVKTHLENTSGLQDNIFLLRFVMFYRNSFFLSEYSIVDDYKKLSDMDILRFENKSTEELRSEILSHREDAFFLPSSSMYSSSLNYQDTYDAVLYTVPTVIKETQYATGAMTFALNSEELINSFLPESFLDDGLFTLTDKDNNAIISQGNLKSDEKTITIQATGKQGLTASLSLPERVIADRISDVLHRLYTYVICGSCLGLILALVYTIMRYIPARRLINYSKSISDVDRTGQNEYDYMLNSLRKVKDEYHLSELSLEQLRNFYKNEVLLNACLRGLFTHHERNVVFEELTDGLSNEFRIIAFSHTFTEAPHEFVNDMKKAFDESTSSLSHVLLNGKSEIIVITGAASVTADEIEAVAKDLVFDAARRYSVELKAGIGDIGNGVENLCICYSHAKIALHLLMDDASSVAAVYERDIVGNLSGILSINLLEKLIEIIRTGHHEGVYLFFNDFESSFFLSDHISFRQQFWTLRMILANAQAEIPNGDSVPLPYYIADAARNEQLNALQDCALKLCDQVINRRKSNNEALRQKILAYIENNFRDVNLSGNVIGEALGVSGNYVHQFVIEQTGKSLSKIIENVRLEYVKNALVTTEYTAEDISNQAGFGAPNTMYRVFKKNFGVTPGAYRKHHLNK